VGRRGASAAAAPDARTDRYVAHDALEKIGFGVKALPYPEHVALAWAATTVDQPVKWIAGRTESHLGDHHGRDFRAKGSFALDEDGHVRAAAELEVDPETGEVTFGQYVAVSITTD